MNQPTQPDPTASKRTWTILKLLSWTSDYFASLGIEHPRADAEILLAHSLGLRRIDLYVQYDKPLSASELTGFRSMVKRRSRREPVAYITGEKEFWSLVLKVTPSVLIPRPETECLVESALAALSEDTVTTGRRVLELGTGSGAIVLAMASENPGDLYFAIDRSEAALGVAKHNADVHGMLQRISFLLGDWFSPVGPSKEPFDLILSNPPYIRRKDMGGLQPEISRFEPKAALDGGPEGTDCLAHIITTAPRFLRPAGHLILEIGHDQKPSLDVVIDGTGCYEDVTIIKDYGGHNRVLKMRKKA